MGDGRGLCWGPCQKGGRRGDRQDHRKDTPPWPCHTQSWSLQRKAHLESNLAAFWNTREKSVSVFNVFLTISKNLKKLEICEAGEGPSSSGVSTSPAEPIPDQNE